MKLPVITVKWVDAWISTDDMSLKRAKKLRPIVRSTTGYLIADKEDCVVMCTDVFEKGEEVSAPMVIPQGWILEMTEYT